MITLRLVLLLGIVILAASAVQAAVHALRPVLPLLIILGIAIAIVYAISRSQDRW